MDGGADFDEFAVLSVEVADFSLNAGEERPLKRLLKGVDGLKCLVESLFAFFM